MDLDQIMNVAKASTDGYKKGMETGAALERQKFEVVIAAYERALQDPSFKAPTYLHLAIDYARGQLEKVAA